MMADPAAVTSAGLKNPPQPTAASASRPARAKTPELTFEREDWTLFRSLSTLSQKAGVPLHLLAKLPEDLHAAVEHSLAGQPAASWRAAVAQVADRLLPTRGCADTPPESEP